MYPKQAIYFHIHSQILPSNAIVRFPFLYSSYFRILIIINHQDLPSTSFPYAVSGGIVNPLGRIVLMVL